MNALRPSMRMKVKADTFFVPDPNGDGVYFRNNEGSFRIEGRSIHLWVEKLLPVFNGQHTLQELTDGLPEPYRDRVYDIAELLYKNGYVRDVSTDLPHQLSHQVAMKYAPQIEFLDSLGGNGAYRFQRYREAKALVVGCGPFLLALTGALLETGLPRVHLLVTDSTPTNRQRITELESHFQQADPEVAVVELEPLQKPGAWRETVRRFDAVFYVSPSLDLTELLALQSACRAERCLFVPAVFAEQAGMAGPLVGPDSKVCWESAWRRLHRSAVCKDPELHPFSPTAAALLANVAVFEWFKSVTEVDDPHTEASVFLLNLETLEGDWHSCLPHPLVSGLVSPQRVDKSRILDDTRDFSDGENGVLSYFAGLTSTTTGVFHLWEEGSLRQFPLPQCRVQPVDPLSPGPALLLPDLVGTGFTHVEARREAGLLGIEAYVARLAEQVVPPALAHRDECIGVGAGVTAAEAVCRGLEKCLAAALRKQLACTSPRVVPVKLGTVEDKHGHFYLQSLAALETNVVIGLGQAICGFPVVWVGANGRWYASVGLNETLALRAALQQALCAQSPTEGPAMCAFQGPSVHLTDKPPSILAIPSCAAVSWAEVLRVALTVLRRNHKRIDILDLTLEPFLGQPLAGVFGVLVRDEEEA
ncbi:putative thiazole-containing bacteriocin maturation protein [Alicyclobacillus kakegawensis]|uniref:putative thiazole-containing bacteriocin maturation protein n=1 Tax=Alicyclobacillus kakegawensis TaxID=392012 RepID=UPI000836493D|nr:putative thiazole-containing bacteriocin maturation protein [Alicyclobacillus kakegawensis]